jgi:hypothetical protein
MKGMHWNLPREPSNAIRQTSHIHVSENDDVNSYFIYILYTCLSNKLAHVMKCYPLIIYGVMLLGSPLIKSNRD